MSETKPTADADADSSAKAKRDKIAEHFEGNGASSIAKSDDSDEESNGEGDHAKASDDAAKEEKTKEDEEVDFLPKGNRLRTKRGVIAMLGGGIPAFLLMAKNGQSGWAVPVGLLFVAIAAWGVMDLLGTFDDAEDRVQERTSIESLAMPLAMTAGALVLFCVFLALAQASIGPWWLGSITVTASFLGLVA